MHHYTQLSLVVGWLLPSLLVGLVLATIASRRLLAFGMALLGGSIGSILAPTVSRVDPRNWEDNLPYVLPQMWGAFGVALAIGGVIVVFDLVRWWRAKQ